MSVQQRDDGTVVLGGLCSPDEAMDLADFLHDGATRVVLEGVEHLHAAHLQTLMALTPTLACDQPGSFPAEALRSAGLDLDGGAPST